MKSTRTRRFNSLGAKAPATRAGAHRAIGWLSGLCLGLGCAIASAQQIVVPAPDAGNTRFGAQIVVLPSGNYVVHDPEWSAAAGVESVGAIYLYSADGVLLSRLTGESANDRIGSGGIVVLPSGDFVVHSPDWNFNGQAAVGAVTWGDAQTGFGASATIDATNSLIGTTAGDRVGDVPIIVLDNGSFVVPSGDWDNPGVAVDAGAATWCAADGSTVGSVSPTNSLVGTSAGDHVGGPTVVGKPGVVALRSGHYVVISSSWDNGLLQDVGAVTWARNDGTVKGPVTAAISLTGTRGGDYVATDVLPLSNGHYVVQSYLWDSAAAPNVGAVTWADGTVPTVGVVSAINSLTGTQDGDRIGYLAAALTNGHYVIASPLWNDGAIADVGAVTWCSGDGPTQDVVDAGNSLVGSHTDDTVGQFSTIGIPPLGVIPLAQGDYVVASPAWDNGALSDVGAATWGSGSGGTVGTISAQNSLIGAASDDAIAQYIVALEDGNYVVASPYWSQSRGAATFGAGQSGVSGVVSAENSLVGASQDDFVTAYGVYELADSSYAVPSAQWSGASPFLGAITRGDAGVGVVGEVSALNSIIGPRANDAIGSRGLVPLPDGGFLVESALSTGTGAITRYAAQPAPMTGTLSLTQSLVGAPADRIGTPGASVQSDGAVVLQSRNATSDKLGAITLFDAADPFIGLLFEPDTVRSSVADGGPLMTYGYLPTSKTLLVGDPLGNRLVRLQAARILRDGFEGD